MTDKSDKQTPSPDKREPSAAEEALAPENHNSEQDDGDSQAQTVGEEALEPDLAGPTESEAVEGGLDDIHEQDLIEHMRDMEASGRIDMDAYRGEPNLDDNVDKYGKRNKVDPLRGDGT